MLITFRFLRSNCLIYYDPGIKSNNFHLTRQQRIDINFFDLGVVGYQVRKPDNRLDQFIQIDRRLTAVTLK